jgi:hypothetical protein
MLAVWRLKQLRKHPGYGTKRPNFDVKRLHVSFVLFAQTDHCLHHDLRLTCGNKISFGSYCLEAARASRYTHDYVIVQLDRRPLQTRKLHRTGLILMVSMHRFVSNRQCHSYPFLTVPDRDEPGLEFRVGCELLSGALRSPAKHRVPYQILSPLRVVVGCCHARLRECHGP